MNNKERSRNGTGKHTALDRQGLIWESRAPQAPPPSSLHRTLADPALSPWLNLPGATSSTNPTLPVRSFPPSLLPSQPPAAFQEAPRPAAEHWPELFRGPAMRPAHPDADGLKPQTLEERHDRDAWPQGRMPRPETMEWRPDRNAWPQGKLPEIQTLEERHNRDAWPQGKMPDPRTLEGRSDMQGLTWEDLPKAPLFPTAADRATAEMVRQALLPGGKVPEGALLASTPLVRPAEAPPQAPPPLWQGRLGADLSDKAEDITIHSRQGNGTYLTSVGGRAPQPLDEGDVTALTDLPTARLQALAAQSEKRSPAAAALLGAAPGAAAAALPPRAEQKASQTPTEGKSAAISSGPDKLRMDRSWSELKQELAKATVETWREYPRTAEQAAANITLNGAELNEREVRMLYEMFHQKYPGWGKRPQVDPTPKKQMPLPPGTPVMEALKPHQLLKEANTQFDKAADAFLASPANWIVDGVTGEKTGGFSFGPDHAWTRVFKNKPVYQRMRKRMSKIAAVEDKLGTLDSRIGWRGDPGKKGYTWDDSADDGPIYQLVVEAANYAAGFELKSTGSTEADLVITNVDHGNRTITFDVHVYDKLRAGSLTRFPKKTPFVGDMEILPDNPFGPFYMTPRSNGAGLRP